MSVFQVIKAPFTSEQVAKLNAFQQCEWHHPFTCQQDGDAEHIKYEFDKAHPGKDFEEHIRNGKAQGFSDPAIVFKQTSLIATEKGWICPVCDYKQDWAHLHMLNELIKPFFP